jgi:hypothetical protein
MHFVPLATPKATPDLVIGPLSDGCDVCGCDQGGKCYCVAPGITGKEGDVPKEREIVCWNCGEDVEELPAFDFNEAIESHLEHYGCFPEHFPETLKVYGYARLEVSAEVLFGSPLEHMLEEADEEYGGPDPTEPTPAMEAAEAAFLAVMAREYEPHPCEVIETRTVNVREWIAEHRPEWLKVKP